MASNVIKCPHKVKNIFPYGNVLVPDVEKLKSELKMKDKMKKLKVFEIFAGFGGSSFALQKAGIDFKTVGYSEIDKYAIQCYEQNHKGKNYGDCTQINPNELPDFDLLVGGFNCQPYSIAGKGHGLKDLRGQVIYDVFRIIKIKKPKYILLENVKGILTKKHQETFIMIIKELISCGYNVDFKLFNSKEYGIPQSRERVFIYGELK